MDQQYRSKFWFMLVLMAVLLLPTLIASESIQKTNYASEETPLNKQGGMTHHKNNPLERDLTIKKRQAVESSEEEVQTDLRIKLIWPQEMLEALNTSVWSKLDELQRGQAALSDLITAKSHNLSETLLDEMQKSQALISNVEHVYHDCQSAWEHGIREPGVYTLSPPGYPSFSARCEFDDQYGWTVIQRRYDGSVDFYLPWDSYKTGFGYPRTEYWLGNDNIYALTRTNRKLSIYLRRYDGQEGTANYSTFYINNEGDNYRLTIAGYSGSVGDMMASHNNHQFSTRDGDHDEDSLGGNCAVRYTGAWWYYNCYVSNLNGVWTSSSSGGNGNMLWTSSWGGGYTKPLQRATMRVTRD